MLTYLRARREREDGFTLIELLIVVIIIGILAAIALPIYLNQQKAAYDGRVQSDVRNTVDQVALFQVSNGFAAYTGSNALMVASKGTTVSVKVNTSTGAYEVWGYNTSGNQYTGATGGNVFDYQSSTGKFISLTVASAPSSADKTVTGS